MGLRDTFLGGAFLAIASLAHAQAPAVTLSGRVTSTTEPRMEGVLVSARKAGSTITQTVVSNAAGHFNFSPAALAAGRYALSIRAVGYELESALEVDAPAANVELKLRKTRDLAAQLTNTEWFSSMPGTAEQKRPLIECMSCHTFERIARSKHDPEAMYEVLKRMATYAINTSPDRPQKRANPRKFDEATFRRLAAYLASINLSKGATWSYALKTLPRPRGRATRVLITEYDLPRKTIAPHDVVTDANGIAWYSNFLENTLGRLDPRTGAHVEYTWPTLKRGAPEGSLALEPDRDGNWWLATMFQTGLVRFNIKDNTFKVFPLPPDLNNSEAQQSMVQPRQAHVDGKVWTTEIGRQVILRLDVATGKYEMVDPFKFMPENTNHSPYGLTADERNNLFLMDFGDEVIARMDAKTLETTIYPTPAPRSRPRRTMRDSQGRIWFAEYAANKVAMFDPVKETFKEWDAPTPFTYPYDVYLDRNGELWAGTMSSDRVLRLAPASGKSIEYLLPRQTNVRRVYVDDKVTPVTFWIGSNHGASIVKLTPLD
ncbi:MAG: streptogramin lyase [Betaproteobacteria bacterium]|nr:streptogramin lyase [Betaproteobacteria bacterium]